ncbi:MAG: antibiotic biosynthesis monooxygenase [Bacteroidetes bacterium]|nr:antibiotic biosynthesis monooxygenase [Bacteroidota bacterium]MDA0903021.1 antibiotic biosynthesis monooxygenase [Bacteroidota bacterium]MDA1241769.1 antibiotic biosynthesis monooxygenase [Bacteroidota bacterium]
MIVRMVRLYIQRRDVEAFEALFWKHHAAIESQPGCLGVELLRDPEDEAVRATLSRWVSVAHLDAYRSSELFGVVWPATKTFFSASPEVWTYTIATQERGAIFDL